MIFLTLLCIENYSAYSFVVVLSNSISISFNSNPVCCKMSSHSRVNSSGVPETLGVTIAVRTLGNVLLLSSELNG